MKEPIKKTLSSLSMYELMADEVDVWVTKSKGFGFTLHLDGYDYEMVEEEIHPCAMEGLADFCNSYLRFYNKAIEQDKEAA
jgi:hypothetical protein